MPATDLPFGLHVQLCAYGPTLRVAVWLERAAEPTAFKTFKASVSTVPFAHPNAVPHHETPAWIPDDWPRENLLVTLPRLGTYLPVPLPGLILAWDLSLFKPASRVIADAPYRVPAYILPPEHSLVVLRRLLRDWSSTHGPGFVSPHAPMVLGLLDTLWSRLSEGPVLPSLLPELTEGLSSVFWGPSAPLGWTPPVDLADLHRLHASLKASKYIAASPVPAYRYAPREVTTWTADAAPTRLGVFLLEVFSAAVMRGGLAPASVTAAAVRDGFRRKTLTRLHRDHGSCLHPEHPLFSPSQYPEGHLHAQLHPVDAPEGTKGWEIELGVLGPEKAFLPIERLVADGTLAHTIVEHDSVAFRRPGSIIERDWSQLGIGATAYFAAPELLTGRCQVSERAGNSLLETGTWPGDSYQTSRWADEIGFPGRVRVAPMLTVAPARQGAARVKLHWDNVGADEASLHDARFVPRLEVVVGDDVLDEHEAEAILGASTAAFVRVHGRVVARDDLVAALELLRAREKVLKRLDAPSGVSWPKAVELDDEWSTDHGFATMETVFSARWEAMLAGLRDGSGIPSMTPPASFKGTLRPYQLRGLSWLSFMVGKGFGGCLADDMGLGKTVQVLALMALQRSATPKPDRPDLVVCPTAVVLNWAREAKKFTPKLRVLVHQGDARASTPDALRDAVAKSDVMVTSYALVRRDKTLLDAIAWGTVVVDEAQNLKNPDALQTRAVKGLRANAKICLTGTPVENHLRDLWSIYDVALPGLLGGPTRFARTFLAPLRNGDPKTMDKLTRRVGPFLLRRTKRDPGIAADLPPKQEQDTWCDLSREQVALYRAMTDATLEGIVGKDGIARRAHILGALTRFKQICNHPESFHEDKPTRLFGRSGKLDRAMELLDELLDEDQKVLVFTQFGEMGRILQRAIAERFDVDADFYHGGVTPKDREAIVDSFNSADGPPVLIVSLKAGGTGLNLTGASAVIHYDRWWNPAVEDQATDRAHRIGQTRSVNVYKFVTRATLEERIVSLLESKRELASKVLGTSQESWITEMDDHALRDFFSLGETSEDA